MGFLGSARGLTPNLDALARQAVVFTRAFSQVPLTTPSHATILTGTYPQFHHVNDLGAPLTKDLPYLPDILRQHGYRTAAFVGSQVLDPTAGAPGFERGFETYNAPFHPRGPGEIRYQSVERRGMAVVNSALDWLNQHPGGPFFAWLHFYDPHDPYDPPPPFNAQYANSLYDGEVAYMDSAFGHLLTELKARNLYDQTLIVVVADHGEAFGEHGERSHGLFLYDDTLHVPLLIKLPGAAPVHTQVENRVGLVDIAPTLLQVIGITTPTSMQGSSLLEVMKPAANGNMAATKSDKTPQDRPQYAETDYPYRAFGWSSLRAWRAGKYLYIDAPKRELYDQSVDPRALHNLADNSPGVANTMAAALDQFRNKTSRRGNPEAALTPRQVEQLQALGYVSSGAAKPESDQKERGPDPKNKVEIANLLHQALLASEEEHYRDAIPLFEQILKSEPDLPLANLQLGRAWNRLEEYGKALPWLKKAADLTPQSVDAHYELGMALGETGDLAGAANQLEAALAQDASSDDLHFDLGSVYEQSGRPQDAIDQYRAALKINPQNFRANLLLGRLLAIQDRPREALAFLEKAVALDPQSIDAHKFLANVYATLGDEQKARREQDEVERLK